MKNEHTPSPDLILPGVAAAAHEAWIECVRKMGLAAREAVLPLVGTEAGREITGLGGGGDRTVALDAVAEEAMLAELQRSAPFPARIVSEELGEAGADEAEWTVVVDPVDGSLNAKRGLPVFSTVVAVARGSALGDVQVGYTMDLPTGVEYLCVRGVGLTGTALVEPRAAGPQVELILLEAGRPTERRFRYDELALLEAVEYRGSVRVRQLGSLALSLCQVALGAADVLLCPVPSRAVDVAAGLALVTESGGGAAGLDDQDLWSQPLDLRRRSPFVAWRAGVDGAMVLDRSRKILGFRP